jgi:putative hydrolase of the HAD superfamily
MLVSRLCKYNLKIVNSSSETKTAPQIDVVLFDVGGVLVELRGIATMLGWFGGSVSVEDMWRLWLSSPVVRRFETGRTTPDEFAEQIIRELSLPVSPEEFVASFQSWFVGLHPGALELVQSLPARYTRATLSNTSVLHWARMREVELEDAFHHHFASHLTGKIKPDQDAYQNVLDTLGCSAESVFFLDDNQLNIEAARQIGMRAIQVRSPAEARQALVEAGILSPA